MLDFKDRVWDMKKGGRTKGSGSGMEAAAVDASSVDQNVTRIPRPRAWEDEGE